MSFPAFCEVDHEFIYLNHGSNNQIIANSTCWKLVLNFTPGLSTYQFQSTDTKQLPQKECDWVTYQTASLSSCVIEAGTKQKKVQFILKVAFPHNLLLFPTCFGHLQTCDNVNITHRILPMKKPHRSYSPNALAPNTNNLQGRFQETTLRGLDKLFQYPKPSYIAEYMSTCTPTIDLFRADAQM